jgi:hypothetical protein
LPSQKRRCIGKIDMAFLLGDPDRRLLLLNKDKADIGVSRRNGHSRVASARHAV